MATRQVTRSEESTTSRFRTARFVGRAEELEVLEGLFQDAQDGRTRCVLLEGEAGVGKTRLLTEFYDTLIDYDCLTLVGHCIPMRGAAPLVPMIEVARHLINELGRDSLTDLAGQGGGLLARLVPELASIRSQDGIDVRRPSVQGPLFQQILELLRGAANDISLVVVFEDLHWADSTSLDLLSFLARELRDERILLVGSFRPEELTARDDLRHVAAHLYQVRLAHRMNLAPFTSALVRDQLTSLIGEHPSPEALDRILIRSQGNPFLVEELLGMGDDEIPISVRDQLLIRVAALSEEARSLLRVAAVAGSEVRHDLLLEATGLDRESVNDALRELVEQHLLAATDGGYRFRHAVLREVVYQDLLPGERIALHGALASALRERLDSRAVPDPFALGRLAYHSEAADDLKTAVVDHYLAARAASSAMAFHEANAHFERVLALAELLPDDPTTHERADVLRQAAYAADMTGNHERAVSLLRTALESENTPEETGAIQLELSHYLWQMDERQESFEIAEAAAGIVATHSPSSVLAHSLIRLGEVRILSGEITESHALAERALRVAREADALREESLARQLVGITEALSSGPRSGETYLRHAVRAAQESRDVHAITSSYVALSMLQESMGRLAEAHETIEEGRSLSKELGFERTYGLWLTANQARLCFKSGSWSEAGELANDVLNGQVYPTHMASRLANATLAELDLAQGRASGARRHIDAASKTQAPLWRDPVPYLDAEQNRLDGKLDQALNGMLRTFERTPPIKTGLGGAAALCWLGMRVAVDRVERARALREPALRAARADADRVLERHRLVSARIGPLLDTLIETRTFLKMAEAEAGRLDGDNDADVWRELVQDWGRLEQPYHRAYALFREAEAAMGKSVARSRASLALLEANAIVGALSADVLRGEIEGLARRARIDLDTLSEQQEGDTSLSHPSLVESLGLTSREVEVLELLVEGKTNPEIADMLFISAKTASVHVSHILMKLQVTNRVEAAGMAHRLELISSGASR